MHDRLGQGAVSEEPPELEQVFRERATAEEFTVDELRHDLLKLENLARDKIGPKNAHDLTKRLWAYVGEAA